MEIVLPLAPEAASELPPLESLHFDAVYDEYFALAWRTARRMGVPESATADVVQDVFVVVDRRLADYDGRTPLKYWVLGIVTNVVGHHRRRFWRKESRLVAPGVEEAEAIRSTEPDPQERAEQAEALRLVVRLLDELPPDKRDVLVLELFEEMTAVEIADCLRLNINTVYARLRAARQAFDAAYARHRARSSRGGGPGER